MVSPPSMRAAVVLAFCIWLVFPGCTGLLLRPPETFPEPQPSVQALRASPAFVRRVPQDTSHFRLRGVLPGGHWVSQRDSKLPEGKWVLSVSGRLPSKPFLSLPFPLCLSTQSPCLPLLSCSTRSVSLGTLPSQGLARPSLCPHSRHKVWPTSGHSGNGVGMSE